MGRIKKRGQNKAGELEREIESLICTAQEQALRANAIKSGIGYQGAFPLCRLCKEKTESFTHIVSFCSALAGNQYRNRHGKLDPVHWIQFTVHWIMSTKFEIECEDKWFSHQPGPVMENDKCKILWDFAIQTDEEIEH